MAICGFLNFKPYWSSHMCSKILFNVPLPYFLLCSFSQPHRNLKKNRVWPQPFLIQTHLPNPIQLMQANSPNSYLSHPSNQETATFLWSWIHDQNLLNLRGDIFILNRRGVKKIGYKFKNKCRKQHLGSSCFLRVTSYRMIKNSPYPVFDHRFCVLNFQNRFYQVFRFACWFLRCGPISS